MQQHESPTATRAYLARFAAYAATRPEQALALALGTAVTGQAHVGDPGDAGKAGTLRAVVGAVCVGLAAGTTGLDEAVDYIERTIAILTVSGMDGVDTVADAIGPEAA